MPAMLQKMTIRITAVRNLRQCAIASIILYVVATAIPCQAQNPNMSYGGFRSYANSGGGNYNAPMGGTRTNNSFNSGFSSFSQPSYSNYNTQRSTQAAQKLARNVSAMWSKAMPAIEAVAQQQQMYQGQQGGYQSQGGYPNQGGYQNQGGMLPSMGKREMLRVFLEGGSPQPTGGGYAQAPSGASSAANRTAYTNYQTAVDEERKARYAEERSRNSNTSQWNRKDDANTAYYAANNANYAAQRAESAANNGDSQARNYAGLARGCANRARANANRARYNADTMK